MKQVGVIKTSILVLRNNINITFDLPNSVWTLSTNRVVCNRNGYVCHVCSMVRALDFRADDPLFKLRPGPDKAYKLCSVG